MRSFSNTHSGFFKNEGYTELQKSFGRPVYNNETNRFIKDKQANTGTDPKGALIEFIKHDTIKPIRRPDLYSEKEKMSATQVNKWAVNTTKQCNSGFLLPKFQQYKEYYFHPRNEEDITNYNSTFLKSDNIALRNDWPGRKAPRKAYELNKIENTESRKEINNEKSSKLVSGSGNIGHENGLIQGQEHRNIYLEKSK